MPPTDFDARWKAAEATACGCRYEDSYPVGVWLIPRNHRVHNGYFDNYIDSYVFQDEADRERYRAVLQWRNKHHDPMGTPRAEPISVRAHFWLVVLCALAFVGLAVWVMAVLQ